MLPVKLVYCFRRKWKLKQTENDLLVVFCSAYLTGSNMLSIVSSHKNCTIFLIFLICDWLDQFIFGIKFRFIWIFSFGVGFLIRSQHKFTVREFACRPVWLLYIPVLVFGNRDNLLIKSRYMRCSLGSSFLRIWRSMTHQFFISLETKMCDLLAALIF